MTGGDKAGRRFGLLKTAAFMGAAYAAGSIPTGKLVTRALTGQRLEDLGDGKVGSSNVARSVGWKAGALVLALDALKAYAPAKAARLAGAGHAVTAAVGVSAVDGHVVFVRGRGAASALGAAFAMDPAAIAIGCVPLVGGSLLHRHAQAVAVTALSLPVISLALHRSPRRALGPLVLITLLFAARVVGSPGSPLPGSPEVLWTRFWLDRDER
ncbi:MAG: glycerol-3-phosphate acyltransferase [Actinobacteria bacterium]|nr:glycerol-3-phosphate acyltransferase [Actinomycetota bacterium]